MDEVGGVCAGGRRLTREIERGISQVVVLGRFQVATDEKRPGEIPSSTGDGRRQYKSNGFPRAGRALGERARRGRSTERGYGVHASTHFKLTGPLVP